MSETVSEKYDLTRAPLHQYRFQVIEKHLDVFGHVNNAQYMALFEEARWDMITGRGYGLKEVLATKIGTVILESTIRYRKELKNREWVTVETAAVEWQKKILTIRQKMLKESGEVSAEAEFKVGCFDLNARKLIVPSGGWLAALLGMSEAELKNSVVSKG